MKELSIEQKVYDGNYKAYTELINRLEDVKDAIKKQNYGIAMDILCKPYPEYQITISTELKESEDEKIRQFLIHEVTETSEKVMSYRNMNKKAVLTWLEKQGEHANFRNKIQVGDKVTRNRDGMLVNLSQLKRVAKPAEKQGEHDMGISKATKQKLEDNLNKALEKETPESLNKFLDGQGEQKPYGQREECFDCQFNYAGECKGSCAIKRGEQQPTWSEEDKERYKSCLQKLGTGNPEQPETINSKWFKEHVYPRPTWKPSEEQMYILNWVSNILLNHNGIVEKEASKKLQSLYNNLKKLTE